MTNLLMVNIGCGTIHDPRWLSLDVLPMSAGIRSLANRKGLPIADGTTDACRKSPPSRKVARESFMGVFPGRRRPVLVAMLVATATSIGTPASCFAQTKTYHIGNSLTGQLLGPNYNTRLKVLSQTEGVNEIHNSQDIRANQPLTHFLNVPVPDGSNAMHYSAAFANLEIDAVFFQPWYGATIRQEAAAAVELVRQLKLNPVNAGARVLVYAAWGSHTSTQSFIDTWTLSDLTLDSPYVPSATAVDLFMSEFKKEVPIAELIPAGEVFYEIGRRLRNKEAIPGIPAFDSLYGDQVHATNAGSYAAGLTAYSVLYRKSPFGLGYPPQMLDPNYGYVLPEHGLLPMQQIVADVVAVPEPRTVTLVVGAVCGIFLCYSVNRFL